MAKGSNGGPRRNWRPEDPKEGRERKGEDALSEKSGASHEEQSERKAQEG